MTQAEFASKLNLSRNFICLVESGDREPSDRTIADICRVFSISENWLRTGEGEMFVQRTRSQEITDFMADLVQTDNEFKRRFVSVLARLDEKDWELIEKMAEMLSEQE